MKVLSLSKYGRLNAKTGLVIEDTNFAEVASADPVNTVHARALCLPDAVGDGASCQTHSGPVSGEIM